MLQHVDQHWLFSPGIMVRYCLRFASQILSGKVDCTILLKGKGPVKVPVNQVTLSYYGGGNFKSNQTEAF